jgi:hypothetical protein
LSAAVGTRLESLITGHLCLLGIVHLLKVWVESVSEIEVLDLNLSAPVELVLFLFVSHGLVFFAFITMVFSN